MTDCYVAFLDPMGVRSLVNAAAKDASLAEKVISALRESRNISAFRRESKNPATGEVSRWKLQVQAFSDCVVLFIPIETKMLSWFFAAIRRLHDRLLRLSIPVRGGITIGGMHWDARWSNEPVQGGDEARELAPVAFGPGLLAAYDLENATAVYPRILVSTALYEHIETQKPKTFPFATGKMLDYCRQDFDGLYHLDVLHPSIDRRDVIDVRQEKENGKLVTTYVRDTTPYPDWLKTVRQFVVESREKVGTNERLEAKYLWLARYYNSKAQTTRGATVIRWFDEDIPAGTIKGRLRQKAPGESR